MVTKAFRSRWLWLLFLVAGCATPPRVGPFVEATVEVRSAVVAAGSTVEAELKGVDGDEDYATRFTELWGARVRAVDALAAYAESLQAITEAGEQGRQAADAVADGVSQLAVAAGLTLPATGTVAAASDAAKLVSHQIALARSARALGDALVRAQPAVEEISRHIALDLGAASEVFEAANADAVRRLTQEHNVELGFRHELSSEQREIYAQGARALSDEDLERLQEVDQLLVSTDTWYGPLQAQLARLAERRRVGSALFAAAVDGIGRWGAAHYALVVAVQEHRPVNAASLLQAALEIRELIRRMREL